jgi:hypothetical protein
VWAHKNCTWVAVVVQTFDLGHARWRALLTTLGCHKAA